MAFHYVVGESIAPLLGLALLVCSFFTRTRSTPVWGAVVMVSIIAQVLLGLAAFHAAAAGAAHGLLAVVTFVIAGYAGHRTASPTSASQREADSQGGLKT